MIGIILSVLVGVLIGRFLPFFAIWRANKKPKIISILSRNLKDNNTYNDLKLAWLPPTAEQSNYFQVPVVVLNAQNIKNPEEIISIGLMWADMPALETEMQRVAITEKSRHDAIAKVAVKIGETKIYQVVDAVQLGK